ncbi:MAG: hypothetical protein AB7U24_06475 [Sulfurimonadaceae bacterium]|jgi:hypothetical protein
MLEKTVWRQFHDENNFREILAPLCNVEILNMIADDKEFYGVLKAKLTKKELKLLAMDTAKVADDAIKQEFGYDDEALKVAKFKVYKKLKQDKFRLSIREQSGEYEE